MKAVSVAEGKKGFSGLIRSASSNKEDIVITKRGTPVAVIVPYDEYLHSKRLDAYRKIMDARGSFSKIGLKASEIFKETKKQLEKRR